MSNPTNEIITMAALEMQCRDRLDYAKQAGEAIVRTVATFDDKCPTMEVTTFETSTGVEITSIGDYLQLRCDFSDNDYGSQLVQTIVFKSLNGGPEVTEVLDKEDGTTSRTLPRRKHNYFAAQMSRLVALEI